MEFKAQLTSELSLWQLSPLEAREQIAALLFLADESWMMINRYLPTAIIYALKQAGEFVGTGDGSVQNIAFYIRAGFRFAEIKTNFFEQYEQPIIENGIQLRDMIVLAKELFI